MTGSIAPGHYLRKQLLCDCGLIAFSHRARYATALRLSDPGPDDTLLDYGCGDGTFVAMVAERCRRPRCVAPNWRLAPPSWRQRGTVAHRGQRPRCTAPNWRFAPLSAAATGHFRPRVGRVIGLDRDAAQIADCRRRHHSLHHAVWYTTTEYAATDLALREQADVITCLEVLEHCPPPETDRVLADLRRFCRPGGRIIISMPIEIGPAFLAKLLIRRIAAWRAGSEYRHYERYRILDACRMIFAGPATALRRPVYGETGSRFHSHYGFNWLAMRERVARDLTIVATEFSPFPCLGAALNSQAWLVCRGPERNP